MTQSIVNPRNVDPYGKFTIRVKWEGRYVAGMSRTTAIKSSAEVARNPSEPSTAHKSPGRAEYDVITLERGVTYDKDFEQWANGTLNPGSGSGKKTSTKDILIEIFDDAGKVAVVWSVHRCRVSKFRVVRDLDNDSNAVTIENITLEHEGCERDPRCDP